MGWLGKARSKKRAPHNSNKFYHPISTLVTGLVCFLFFAALAIISNVVPNKTTTWWTTSIFVGFAVLSFPLILDFFRAKHEITDRDDLRKAIFACSTFILE
jgi:uncharacterized membrane protein YdbT with pleckstrin-like domain